MRTLLLVLLFLAVPVRADDPPSPPPDYKSKYHVIDVHLHCRLTTGQTGEQTLRAKFDVDDRVGVAAGVILDAGSPEGSLAGWLKLKQKFPDRLIVFYKLNFKNVDQPTFFADIVREIEDGAKQGVQGVKVWKDLGMYNRDGAGKLLRADEERLDPFWDKCVQLKLPILWHAADPREYWFPLTYNSFHYGMRKESDQLYHIPKMPGWDELLKQRETVMRRHPGMIVVDAHFGSMCFDLERLERTFAEFPNFYVDTSARMRIVGRLNPPAMREFFTKYQDRILFGTDINVLSGGRKDTTKGNIYLYPSDDANVIALDPTDPADRDKIKRWQNRAAFDYGQSFQYLETDEFNLVDPMHSGGPWLRYPGMKLPPEVLEKVYHANAERLIPGLKK
jgi:uncharacterized protein